MTFSSCLIDEDSALVLDASVVINLLATGHIALILNALNIPIVVTKNVVREIEIGAVNGRSDFDLLSQIIDDRVVRVAELESDALQTFFDLVSGSASESLGDGEASTLAFAHMLSCPAAIDERKATRLATDRFDSMKLITTIDILAHKAIRSSLGQERLAEAAFKALRLARMQVREHQFKWVAQVIGPEKIAVCSSLRRLARRHAMVIEP